MCNKIRDVVQMWRILVTAFLCVLAGMVLGAVAYIHYYHISTTILEKYNLPLVVLPALAFLVVGYMVGKRGNKKEEFSYKPLFQGKVQVLNEGEKILKVSMERSGMVREKGR